MTLKEFFALLPKTGWYLEDGVEIRRRGSSYSGRPYPLCPLNVVYRRVFKSSRKPLNSDCCEMGRALELRNHEDIICSADDRRGKYRKALLKACGLKEGKGENS